MENEKWKEYSVKILTVLQDMLEEDEEFSNELTEGNNTTEFFHALANVVPTTVFNKLTGGRKNYLEFNHVANQLVFQYSENNKNKL